MDQNEKLAGVSAEAVKAATGKTWAEWLTILDASGANEMKHPDIAAHLAQEHGLSGWWSQMVTVGYEQARGMREVYQKTDGFTANASRTINVPVSRLFQAWIDEAQRVLWLPEAALTIRKATPDRSLRVSWADDTGVDVYLNAKSPDKSQIAIQHTRLPDAEASQSMKAYWTEALGRLKQRLEG